jgi:hypothetical protein
VLVLDHRDSVDWPIGGLRDYSLVMATAHDPTPLVTAPNDPRPHGSPLVPLLLAAALCAERKSATVDLRLATRLLRNGWGTEPRSQPGFRPWPGAAL